VGGKIGILKVRIFYLLLHWYNLFKGTVLPDSIIAWKMQSKIGNLMYDYSKLFTANAQLFLNSPLISLVLLAGAVWCENSSKRLSFALKYGWCTQAAFWTKHVIVWLMQIRMWLAQWKVVQKNFGFKVFVQVVKNMLFYI
jgi:hypothetical protein